MEWIKTNGEELNLTSQELLYFVSHWYYRSYKSRMSAFTSIFAYRILLLVSCGRPFNKFKLVKSYLRSTVSQDIKSGNASNKNVVTSSLENSDVTAILTEQDAAMKLYTVILATVHKMYKLSGGQFAKKCPAMNYQSNYEMSTERLKSEQKLQTWQCGWMYNRHGGGN